MGQKKRFLKIRRKLILFGIGFAAFPLFLVLLYRFVDPPITWLMVERRFFSERSVSELKHHSIPFNQHSRWVPLAVIASEDQNYLEHFGIDPQAIRQAIKHNRRHPHRLRGASTLSQQTAKNVFLWETRSWWRKLLEIPFTVAIETLWGKERILEVYLNVCELGPGVFGFEAAARHWFGKPSARLTRREATLLVGMLPAPRRSHPRKPGSFLLKRAQWIEQQLQFMDTSGLLRELDW